jgi:hypothetical protein
MIRNPKRANRTWLTRFLLSLIYVSLGEVAEGVTRFLLSLIYVSLCEVAEGVIRFLRSSKVSLAS